MGETETQAEVIAPGAIARYQAEQESMNTIARANPRNQKTSLAEALQELELAPEYACKAFYSIPFKDNRTGETKSVEGPSINATKTLSAAWGNCSDGCRIIDQDSERIIVEGVFIDHEKNKRTVRTKAVSRLYLDKATKTKKPFWEDALVKSIGAAMSKAVRDATLAGLPHWYSDSYYKKARQIAAKSIGGKADSTKPQTYVERIAWLVNAFGKLGVTPEILTAYMKERIDPAFDDEERLAETVGIYNAIKDGQASAAEIFGIGEAAKADEGKTEGAKEGQVTMDDVVGKKKAKA